MVSKGKQASNGKRGVGSTQHAVPKPPSREDILRQGTRIDGPRKRGQGTRQDQFLSFMAANPGLMVDHEFIQAEFGLKHPQQARQPLSKMADKNLVDIIVYKEERGQRLVDIYRYTLTPLGFTEAVRRGMPANVSEAKKQGVIPEGWKRPTK